MANRYYIKGRSFEYKIKKLLIESGAYVIRSAKSHSYADLIVLYNNSIKLLQLKVYKKKATPKEVFSDVFLRHKIPLYILQKYGHRNYALLLGLGNWYKTLYDGKNVKEAIKKLLFSRYSIVFS